MSRNDLTDKQALFVEEYLKDFNATQAALRAKYSPKTSHAIGRENLQKPVIRAALAVRVQQLLDNAGITAEHVLHELSIVAFSDIHDYVRWDEDRVAFIPGDDLDPQKRRVIAEIQAETTTRTFEDSGLSETTVKFKLKPWDKLKALEKLGQYLKLFVDRQEITGKDGEPIAHQLTNTLDSALEAAYAHRNGAPDHD